MVLSLKYGCVHTRAAHFDWMEYTTIERDLVHPKLLQHTITMLSSRHPSELRVTLYSGPGQRLKFHSWFGSGISINVIVTCGANGLNISKSSSTDFPYRRFGLGILHSPPSGRNNAAGYLNSAVF